MSDELHELVEDELHAIADKINRMVLSRAILDFDPDGKGAVGDVKNTERGFERVDFLDAYGGACSLQRSSAGSDMLVWLGRNEERMHLNPEQVTGLVILLTRWLKGWSFKEDEDAE